VDIKNVKTVWSRIRRWRRKQWKRPRYTEFDRLIENITFSINVNSNHCLKLRSDNVRSEPHWFLLIFQQSISKTEVTTVYINILSFFTIHILPARRVGNERVFQPPSVFSASVSPLFDSWLFLIDLFSRHHPRWHFNGTIVERTSTPPPIRRNQISEVYALGGS